jgi:uncharacterized protein (UPF0303 family)
MKFVMNTEQFVTRLGRSMCYRKIFFIYLSKKHAKPGAIGITMANKQFFETATAGADIFIDVDKRALDDERGGGSSSNFN